MPETPITHRGAPEHEQETARKPVAWKTRPRPRLPRSGEVALNVGPGVRDDEAITDVSRPLG